MAQPVVDTRNVELGFAAAAPGLLVAGSGQMQRTLKRRRVLLASLMIAAFFSLVLALATGEGLAWAVHGLVDALLVGYLALLIRARDAAARQEMARRQLDPAGGHR